ncbi:F0F1 ATP synthase subunit delta [Bacillus atrophaeus]|uniref:F0F1 ATP synthase subunit delta n=1 Tax=Bacillus atrophaeus TaxID=1452 RepID=UPI0022824599|nr:F0F1 ATP synthase subunit delta [Bacillus atrophaeus]MCY8523369.1 F0F1 ATP synthase subunit delta [Bacillus atrophaeus]MCY8524937.1 F0F1 ATP synthase subunit delta [Bacillus atrophaeus]MEC0696259.1 F0F1 ATP synthase subunit delta [Bacillus atrophaeus]
MSGSAVSKRYASALFDIALESSQINEIEEELKVVKEVFQNEKALNDVLNHPKVPAAKKKELVQNAFGSVAQPVLHTIFLLIDRHRTSIVPDLTDEFVKLANKVRQTEDAIVYSVKPLTDAETKSLSQVFAKKAGVASLRIRNEVQTDLIGGVKVRIGNRIFDGSVSGKLERIERQLAGEIR